MKTFKVIDFWLQVLLIAFCGVAVAANSMDFYYSYFIAGGWQFTSMLIHEATKSFIAKGSARRVYQNTTYILVTCMALTPVVYITGIVFVPMLFAAPFMAVFYTRLCYREIFIYSRRPLSVLK